MGILRKLRQWREKSDGTLEGPALSTDEVGIGKGDDPEAPAIVEHDSGATWEFQEDGTFWAENYGGQVVPIIDRDNPSSSDEVSVTVDFDEWDYVCLTGSVRAEDDFYLVVNGDDDGGNYIIYPLYGSEETGQDRARLGEVEDEVTVGLSIGLARVGNVGQRITSTQMGLAGNSTSGRLTNPTQGIGYGDDISGETELKIENLVDGEEHDLTAVGLVK